MENLLAEPRDDKSRQSSRRIYSCYRKNPRSPFGNFHAAPILAPAGRRPTIHVGVDAIFDAI
jgi:hypothetical protein